MQINLIQKMQELEECLYNIDMSIIKLNNNSLTSVTELPSGVGGVAWQSVVTASTLNAESNKAYPIDTTSNTCTITMPSNPSVGDQIIFMDYARKFGTNKIIINQNSKNFQASTTKQPEYNTDGQSITCVYVDATQGWIPQVDDDVTYETDPAYPISGFLCIAGGGGGGYGYTGGYYAGGGGAGGYRNSYGTETSGRNSSTETQIGLQPGQVYTITIGAGGSAGAGNGLNGSNGSNSSIVGAGVNIVSIGGGFGMGGNATTGNSAGDGGSGGGASDGNQYTSATGGNGTAGQGFDGGSSPTNANSAGSGGGAGGAGVNASSTNMAGGAGLASSITDSAVTRASGGIGSRSTNAGTTSANTGNGGDGSIDNNTSPAGGGSGVVILRIPTANYSGTTSGSPSVSTSGSDKILVFNSSGSVTG